MLNKGTQKDVAIIVLELCVSFTETQTNKASLSVLITQYNLT